MQADYMAGPPGETWNFKMDSKAVSLTVSTMAEKGINLHIFHGNEVYIKNIRYFFIFFSSLFELEQVESYKIWQDMG